MKLENDKLSIILRRLQAWNEGRTKDVFKALRRDLFSQLQTDWLRGGYDSDPNLKLAIAFFIKEATSSPDDYEVRSTGTYPTNGLAVKARAELEVLMKAYNLGGLVISESFKKSLEEMYAIPAGASMVREMLCALGCATMATKADATMRVGLAYLASKMLYLLLYETVSSSQSLVNRIDESARCFCDFLNTKPHFVQCGRAEYVSYGATFDTKIMEHRDQSRRTRVYSDKPFSPEVASVKPHSCYFYFRNTPQVCKKAQVEIIG